MRMGWSDDDLVAMWTLVGEDWSLVGNKTGATRLGFAVLLKFFEIEARFPRSAEEVPPAGRDPRWPGCRCAARARLDPEALSWLRVRPGADVLEVPHHERVHTTPARRPPHRTATHRRRETR